MRDLVEIVLLFSNFLRIAEEIAHDAIAERLDGDHVLARRHANNVLFLHGIADDGVNLFPASPSGTM